MAGGVLCVMFTDLAGSTELMTGLGDVAFDELRSTHFAALRQVIADAGGAEIKNTGDGLLATFTSAVDALAAATGAQQATARHAHATGLPLSVRVGLALGEVTVQDADVFGTPVVEAARLVARAQPGQILASGLVRAVAGSRAGVAFTDLGCIELKGLPRPVAVCEVQWEPVTAAAAVPLPDLLLKSRVFVGRDAEMAALRARWKEVVTGGRELVLLGGEPGIGKTRLAAELAESLHAEGALVLAGRCDEDMGVPYQPFVEALRHYVAHASAPLRLGRHAGELARLVPELPQLVGGLPQPLRSDPETERYRLFDAMTGWLADASAETPMLLVLDDLQWAAKPTVLLLRHLLRAPDRARLLVVATYRDTDQGEAFADFLADVSRLDGAERWGVPGLNADGVAAFLEAAVGHALDGDGAVLAQTVWRETEGNCFFVGEVLRNLAESGALEERDGRWVTVPSSGSLPIPEGVRDVIRRRLARLPEETSRMLATAAVVGLEFDATVLEVAGRYDEDRLLDALEGATRSRLIVELPGGLPRYRFAHALVRTTLYDGLSAARRCSLHRRVAEAIERIQLNQLDDHLPALAHHWAQAATDSDRAVDYATRAGDRALAQLAYDQAARFYTEALQLLAADDHRRLDLLIALGDAQHRAGDPSHRQTLLEAARRAQEQRDPGALARAALAAIRPGFTTNVGRVDEELVTVLEAAVEAAATPAVKARLLSALALEMTYARRDRVLQLANQALALARKADDPASLGAVLANRIYSIMEPSTLRERLENTAELAEIADRLGDPGLRFGALWNRSRVLLEVGDVAGAGEFADRCMALADDLGQPAVRWMASWISVGPVLAAGHVDEASRRSEAALAIGRQVSEPGAELIAVAQRMVIEFEHGCTEAAEAAEAALRRLGAQYPGVLAFGALVAWSSCEGGRLDEARAALDPLYRLAFRLPPDPTWLTSLMAAAAVVYRLGDSRAAETLTEILSPWSHVWGNSAGVTMGVTAYYLGLLSATAGDSDRAERHLYDAADRYQAAGAPAHLGRTWVEHARLLLRRGDVESARHLLDRALTIAGEHGLINVQRRARTVLEAIA